MMKENEARKEENVRLEKMILKSDEKINGLLKTIANMAVNEDLKNDVQLLKKASEVKRIKIDKILHIDPLTQFLYF